MKKRSDGRWTKKITLPNGKSKYLYSTAKSEREAVKDFNQQMLQYEEAKKQSLCFVSVAEEWEKEHFPTLQHNTLKQYKPASKEVQAYFKNFNITDILPSHVNAFINSLAKKGYAQKTVKSRLLVLSLIFKYAIMQQYVTQTPCQFITAPKNLPKTKREAASDKDIKKIKKNTDTQFGLLALFLLLTGCRRGEALALSPDDVDFKNKTVHISKTVEWIGNKPNIKNSPKTDAGNRDIPLPDILIKKFKPLSKQKFLFQNASGTLLDNSQVTRGWSAYQKETGITATPHQLRHAYQTMLFDAGVDIKTAQRWLGHADIKTTLEIYTHLSETRLNESTKKMVRFLDKNSSKL